jgi:hypothetical protein
MGGEGLEVSPGRSLALHVSSYQYIAESSCGRREETTRMGKNKDGAYLLCPGRFRFSLKVAHQPDVGRKVRNHPFV